MSLFLLCIIVFLSGSGDPPDLHVLPHSFPPRRSADVAATALLGLTPVGSSLFFPPCCAGAVRPAGAADNSGAARHATRAGRRAGPHLATAPHAHAVLNARLGLWPAHHPPCGRLRRWLPSDRLAHGLTPLFCPRGPFLEIGRAHV